MKIKRLRIPTFLFADFLFEAPENFSRLIVLLHGYEESGARILDKLKGALPPGVAVLAPNGPFPLPRRTERGARLGFTWYVYDAAQDQYYIDMEIAVNFLTQLILKLGLAATPTTLIGFSQGGYLAPFVASQCPQVDRVIGLSCRFLQEELERPLHFQLDAIHGAQDVIVPAGPSQKDHAQLLIEGVQGRFYLLADSEHRIDQAVLDQLTALLKSDLAH